MQKLLRCLQMTGVSPPNQTTPGSQNLNARKTQPPWDGDERRAGPRRTTDEDIDRLEKLVREMPQLTVEEHKLMRDVLEAYRGWQVLGRAAKLLVLFLAGVSAVVVASGHIKEALRSWML